MMRTAARGSGLLLALTALVVSGCGGPRRVAEPQTQVRLDPPPAEALRPEPARALPLPDLPVTQVQAGRDGHRIQRLEAVDQDLRLVLRGLAEHLGIGYQIDPAVSGRVTARFDAATLEEVLDALVLPRGFTYTLQAGVLRVGPATVQTRIFSLDYISINRFGSSTTVVQRRLGTGTRTGLGAQGLPGQQAGIGAQAGVQGGADVIMGVAVADLWGEITVAMEALVFPAQVATQPAGLEALVPSPAGGPVTGGMLGVGGMGAAPGPYSRVTADGRRLVVNPIAGTILVSAPPPVLAEVETFLAAFAASVQRQVLIEAKIVEVLLDRRYQFGIDWSLVQRLGALDVEVRRGGEAAAGVELTLGRGGQEVSLVLDLLDTQGEVRVLSSPRVSALNNQRAVFNVTTDEVFFAVSRQPILGPDGGTVGFTTVIDPQQIAVGIVLDVLSQVGPDNVITMNVRPVVTTVVRVEEIRLPDGSHARAPVIDRRETDTVVRVRGGETIVIGGLMQTRRESERSGVPLLMDVPMLGRLFSSRREREVKSELVIFLTPTIVAGQPPGGS
jgi:MSHA biogenesis protein MshL